MGTGQYVNFHHNDDNFSIGLDDAGNLAFRANGSDDAGTRRMVILDGATVVSFDGGVTVEETVTIGGSGHDGGLQLRASDGDNTLFLGSSGDDVNIVLGGNGRTGRIQAKNDDGEVTVDLSASAGSLTLGTSGQDGDITIVDQNGVRSIAMSGDPGTLDLWYGSQKTISMDGSAGHVTVGTADQTGKAGTIDVCDANGAVTIKLSGDQGLIEYDVLQQDETPDGSLTAHQPVRDALARVRALRAVSYRTTDEAPRIGLRGKDVARVCPELVAPVGAGRTGVSYSRLTALLVEAVKEQQVLIDGLRERLDHLEHHGNAA